MLVLLWYKSKLKSQTKKHFVFIFNLENHHHINVLSLRSVVPNQRAQTSPVGHKIRKFSDFSQIFDFFVLPRHDSKNY